MKRDHGLLAEGAASLTAEKIFDARWTMMVLGEALEKLRQEYATEEKRPHSKRYKFTWILVIVSRLRMTRWRIGLDSTVGGVKTLIHRLAKALHRTFARRGRPHGIGCSIDQRGDLCPLRRSERCRRTAEVVKTQSTNL